MISATSSKRCGWRGTSSSSGRGAGKRDPGHCSSGSSSPSRVTAASTTGRPKPRAPGPGPRQQFLRPGATSNFRLPITCTTAAAGKRAAAVHRLRSAPARSKASASRRMHQRRGTAAPLRRAALGGQPGVGQHHRHAGSVGAVQQVGPDLGFHQHAHRRPVVLQEAAHRTRRVPGQPGLRVTVAQQRGAGSRPVAVPWVSSSRKPGR
jgi:hypothetical protein